MQLADRIAVHNRAHPRGRCLLMPYDDLNPGLSRPLERMGNERKSSVTETLAKFRLVDHIDAILSTVVPRIIDAVLDQRKTGGGNGGGGAGVAEPGLDLGDEPRRAVRRWTKPLRHD